MKTDLREDSLATFHRFIYINRREKLNFISVVKPDGLKE